MCSGLACACACHAAPPTLAIATRPLVRTAPPETLQDAQAAAVRALIVASRDALGARGPARRTADARLADALTRLEALG